MIFWTRVLDVYNRGCSFWIRGSTHSPLLPLDGPSHNLSQSKIKICWKTEKTQFTAQAHATPQNAVCVFRFSLMSEKYNYLDIQNISLTQVPQLKSPCCTIQTSWSTHYWFKPNQRKQKVWINNDFCLCTWLIWLCTWTLGPVKLVVWLLCILHFFVVVYTTHSQMLGKFEYTRGPIFKVVLEC